MRFSRSTIACLLAVTPALSLGQTVSREVAPVNAAPLNAPPSWLRVGGQVRARAEAYQNGGFRPDNSDAYLLTRVLLNAVVHPTAKTLLFVEGMDARGPWKNKSPEGPPFRDHADLRQL